MKRWQLGQILGIEVWFSQSSLLLSGLLWLIFSGAAAIWLDLSLVAAIIGGFTAVCLHWFGDLFHHLGHAWAAR